MAPTDLPVLSGFLVIDKPVGLTSHDVVARVRRAVRMKRVGHGGTLDPFATGVLPVAVGTSTRMLQYIQSGLKGYRAHVVLGVETDSGDVDGTVVASARGEAWPPRTAVDAAARTFVGRITQQPPALSAIKLGGIPLHRRVRAGEQVEAPTRMVDIYQIDIERYDPPDLHLAVACGSGTYIRSLARDLGRALGSFGYCHALRRTNAGPFCLGDAVGLETLEGLDVRECWPWLALSADYALHGAPAVLLDEQSSVRWYHGRSLEIEAAAGGSPSGLMRVYDPYGRFAGVGNLDESRGLQPRLVLPPMDRTVDQ
jgi:tRNA pseudouridine55 synthase